MQTQAAQLPKALKALGGMQCLKSLLRNLRVHGAPPALAGLGEPPRACVPPGPDHELACHVRHGMSASPTSSCQTVTARGMAASRLRGRCLLAFPAMSLPCPERAGSRTPAPV